MSQVQSDNIRVFWSPTLSVYIFNLIEIAVFQPTLGDTAQPLVIHLH